ncbi:MAG: cytochrome c3 family protein [Phycisphaerae bacterium]
MRSTAWLVVAAAGCAPADRLTGPSTPASPTALADLPPDRVQPPAPLPVARGAKPFASIHPPFAARRCRDCHQVPRVSELVQPWSARCGGCHPRVFAGPVLHGPAGAMACNACHLPHLSTLPKLLRQFDPALCLSCHEPTLKPMGAAHADLARRCTECHDPHGGADLRLLRPGHAATAPASQPAPPGAAIPVEPLRATPEPRGAAP